MTPHTDKVFQFKTKRVDFCRRESHKHKQVIILQFEGVLGELTRKSLTEEGFYMHLRHGVAEGVKELLKNFQVVLFSFLSEKSILMAVEHLIRQEEIVFDAVYTKIKTFKKSDSYCSYN